MAGRTKNRRLRFTRLSMRAWRNFNRKAELKLGPRTFLIGPNASGKSNVLDALRFLRDVAESGLGKAVEIRGGMGEVRSLHAKGAPSVELSVDVASEDESKRWSYTLRFRNRKGKQAPEVALERVHVDGKCVLERPDKKDRQDRQDRERLARTHLEQASENRKFRELADFFKTIRYQHIVPQIVRNPGNNGASVDDPFGGGFLKRVAATNKKTRDSRLAKIQKAMQVVIPGLRKLELERDSQGDWRLYAGCENWHSPDARQSEAALSDGTLRMMGLLWALSEGGGPLLLEEPELGVHDYLLSSLPGMMARMSRTQGNQVLVTTYSTSFLRDHGIDLEEIYLLVPGNEGTKIKNIASIRLFRAMVETGYYPGESVMPGAAPGNFTDFSLPS